MSPSQAAQVAAVIGEQFKRLGAPSGWNPKKETVLQYFERKGAKLFELHCSYGMSGWIAARSMASKVVKIGTIQEIEAP